MRFFLLWYICQIKTKMIPLLKKKINNYAKYVWRLAPDHHQNVNSNVSAAKDTKRKIVKSNEVTKWHPPEAPFVKINFDGYVVGDNAAAGFVIRDGIGQLIIAGALNLGEVTILVAKALALMEALKCGKHKGFLRICMEGDSKLDAVQGFCGVPWRLRPIIDLVVGFLLRLYSVEF